MAPQPVAWFLGATLVLSAASASTARAQWTTTGPIAVRDGFAGVVLPDDRVVVSGGWGEPSQTEGARNVLVWSPSTNAWTAAPPMRQGRAEHAMLRLANGDLVVAGGRDRDVTLRSSEVWKAGEAVWREGGGLSAPRRRMEALALPDGRAVVFGGDEPSDARCRPEIWEGRAARWVIAAEVPELSCGAGAALLSDGRVLLAGGWDKRLENVGGGVWDPVKRTWRAAPPLPSPRRKPVMLTLRDGRVLAVGGYDGPGQLSRSWALFDPSTWKWLPLAGAPATDFVAHAVRLANGDVVAQLGAGASRGTRWTPMPERWSALEDPPLGGGRPWALSDGRLMLIAATAPKAQIWAASGEALGEWRPWMRPDRFREMAYSLSELPDGRVLLAGGATLSAKPGQSFSETAVELFDPATGLWRAEKPMKAGREGHAVAVLPDGRVLVAGGVEHAKVEPTELRRRGRYEPPKMSAGMLDAAEVWDSTHGWRPTGSLREARVQARAVALPDGRVLVLGGVQATTGPDPVDPRLLTSGRPRILSSGELWSSSDGRWRPIAPMAEARVEHTATLLADGRVLVVGGAPSDAPAVTPAVAAEVWDPHTGAWTPIAQPRWPRAGHAALRLPDGRVVIAGGTRLPAAPGREEANALDAVEIWDPRADKWTDAAPLNLPRRGPAMALLSDGRLLVVGGTGGTNRAEVGDLHAGTWTFTGPLGIESQGALLGLRDGRALLVGPASVQVWSPR